MNNEITKNTNNDVVENVVAGIVGAFLFSLVGGILWFVIYQFGFIAGISGVIGSICAIKGYTLFAKKESTKGIIISVIISLLVIVLAWYLCLAYDVYTAYKMWFEAGESEFALTYFESVRVSHYFLSDPEVAPAYFGDLAFGIIFCIIGGASNVITKIKNNKNKKAIEASTPIEAPVVETPVEPEATAEANTSTTTDTNKDETVFH